MINNNILFKFNIPIHFDERKTPIRSTTMVMRTVGKYVERTKQLCVNGI